MERYHKPRELESRQRLEYDCKPTYTQLKASLSHIWRFPQDVDAATSAHAALDAFMRFRDKKKKPFHYINTLHRMQTCSGTFVSSRDWRLRILLTGLRLQWRKVLNKPRLAALYAKLKLWAELERLTRFIVPKLGHYTPSQLATLATAYGTARLCDFAILPALTHRLSVNLHLLSPRELIQVLDGFARQEYFNWAFFGRVNSELMSRKAPMGLALTVAWVEALARAHLVDYAVAEAAAVQAKDAILLGRGYTTGLLARLLVALEKLEIFDSGLVRMVARQAEQNWFDWTPDGMAIVCHATSRLGGSPLLLRLSDQICSCDDLGALTKAAELATSRGDPLMTRKVRDRVIQKRNSQQVVDVNKLARMFMQANVLDSQLWEALANMAINSVEFYESGDILESAEIFGELPSPVLTAIGGPGIARMLAQWAIKRHSEFSAEELRTLVGLLSKNSFDCGVFLKREILRDWTDLRTAEPTDAVLSANR